MFDCVLLYWTSTFAKGWGGYSFCVPRSPCSTACLVGRPHAVIFGELTTGLDPHNRRLLWELVRALAALSVAALAACEGIEAWRGGRAPTAPLPPIAPARTPAGVYKRAPIPHTDLRRPR
jgi:hypothetical protein